MGGIEQPAATTALARVLAHERARGGQRVVFAHHVHGAGVIARRDKRNIGRHVHVRGAQRLARNLLLGAFGACMVFDMARIFVGMGFKAHQELGRGFVANGAVGGIADHFRQNAGAVEIGGRRIAVENIAHQRAQAGAGHRGTARTCRTFERHRSRAWKAAPQWDKPPAAWLKFGARTLRVRRRSSRRSTLSAQ